MFIAMALAVLLPAEGDASKLKVGDKVQVDFLRQDGQNDRLSAATIWPAR